MSRKSAGADGRPADPVFALKPVEHAIKVDASASLSAPKEAAAARMTRSSCDLISSGKPARITAFANAEVTEPYRTLTFRSVAKLADFLSKAPLEREAKRDAPLFSRGACKGRR